MHYQRRVLAWSEAPTPSSLAGSLHLDEYAHEKTWLEPSGGDRRVARAMAPCPSSKVCDVRRVAGMSTNQFNPYRDRLVKRGVVDGSTYGHVRFALPLFERYVMENSPIG